MTNLPNNHIALEIPEDAIKAYVLDSGNGKKQGLFWKSNKVESPPWVILPPGEWILVNTSEAMKEGECRLIVDKFNYGAYRDYSCRTFDPANDSLPILLSARESFTSLLKSLNLNGRYAILKLK